MPSLAVAKSVLALHKSIFDEKNVLTSIQNHIQVSHTEMCVYTLDYNLFVEYITFL